MNIILSTEPGLSTAWLMATVGNRTVHRKLSRKELCLVSVPRLCELLPSNGNIYLRMASNLMYGLTLIHHQQVRYVFDDVNSVHLKLAKPPCFDRYLCEQKSVQHRQRRHVPLPDCDHFTMGDFAAWDEEWFQDESRVSLEKSIDNYMSLAQRADAMDRLLDEIMNQTIASIRNETTLGEAGFEFNIYGGIDGDMMNLEDEFHVSQGSHMEPLDRVNEVEALRNRDSRDPHFSTTLNPLRSTVDQAGSKSRAKRRWLAVDDVTVLSPYAFSYPLYFRNYDMEAPPMPASRQKKTKVSPWKILKDFSTLAPPMLNYARHCMLQPPQGTIAPSRMPSFMRERFDEVETGRNVQGLMDAIEYSRGVGRSLDSSYDSAHLIDTLDLDDIELALEDACLQFPLSQTESQGPVGHHLHRLASKLLLYIQRRAVQYGTLCDYEGIEAVARSQEYRKVSFEAVFPRQPLEESDIPVTRKLAAKSFGTVLELATKKAIHILQGHDTSAERCSLLLLQNEVSSS